jgi:hypothetical protein
MATKITDPALLAQLNSSDVAGPKKVTDPAVLAQLNGTAPTNEAPAADTSGIAPQALSGVNEGLANFLSLPNSLELGARSIGPMIANAFGGHFAMPDKSLLPDAGADYRRLADTIGAIKPETDNPVGKFSRRVGQELGANLVPSLGVESKMASLLASLGSGTAAATAQQIAPDNPGAELAAEMLGGGGSLGVANALERKAAKMVAPSVEALKTKARGLYDAAEARGVSFPQPAVKRLADDIAARAINEGIDPTLHPRATAALQRLQQAGATGMTIKDAQTLRRVIAGAGKDPMNPDEGRIAHQMLDQLDNFVGGAAPELATARGVYGQAKRAERIEQAIELAGSRAGQFSGSGFENALRTEFRALERKIIKGQIKGLSQDEIDSISKVARGGPVENVLRFVGKFAPSGNVSTIGGALAGNAFGGPAGAGMVLGGGAVGRALATRMTIKNAKIAAALAARGGAAKVPAITPKTASAAEALLLGQAANQNTPGASVAEALRRPTRAIGQ